MTNRKKENKSKKVIFFFISVSELCYNKCKSLNSKLLLAQKGKKKNKIEKIESFVNVLLFLPVR